MGELQCSRLPRALWRWREFLSYLGIVCSLKLNAIVKIVITIVVFVFTEEILSLTPILSLLPCFSRHWKIEEGFAFRFRFTSRLQNSQEHRLLRQQHLWIPTKSGNPKGLCQPCCLHRWSTILVVQGFGQGVLGEELGLWEARAGRCCVRQHWVWRGGGGERRRW